MPEKDEGATEVKESLVILSMIFPANNESSEVMKPGKEAFDFPTFGREAIGEDRRTLGERCHCLQLR